MHEGAVAQREMHEGDDSGVLQIRQDLWWTLLLKKAECLAALFWGVFLCLIFQCLLEIHLYILVMI